VHRRPELLRILFVVPALGHGGAEHNVATLLRRMDPDRFRAAVRCVKRPGATGEQLAADGFDCRDLGCVSRLAAPRAFVSLTRQLRQMRPHVVATFPTNAHFVGRAAARAAGVPVVAGWNHSCAHLRGRWLDRRCEQLLAPVTDWWFALADSQVPFLVEGLGVPRHKIRIVRNGVDTQVYRPAPNGERDERLAASLGIAPGERIVGIVAHMRSEKDHATFLDAGRRIIGRVPDTRLLLVGDGPLRQELEEQAERLGLGARAIFAGRRDDVSDLLRIMDVSMLSSSSECLPYAALESMASGVPLVATAVGAIPEIVGDEEAAVLVPPGRADALADATVALLQDRARARAIAAGARRRVEARYTVAAAVRDAEEAFEEVVSLASRRRR
jgi:glycosyltransferase involved in cell wall biosynthesis